MPVQRVDVLVLTREDLCCAPWPRHHASAISIADVLSFHRRSVELASVVLLMEDDWTSKILKNRYGGTDDVSFLTAMQAVHESRSSTSEL